MAILFLQLFQFMEGHRSLSRLSPAICRPCLDVKLLCSWMNLLIFYCSQMKFVAIILVRWSCLCDCSPDWFFIWNFWLLVLKTGMNSKSPDGIKWLSSFLRALRFNSLQVCDSRKLYWGDKSLVRREILNLKNSYQSHKFRPIQRAWGTV